jgi:hypothetical protein
MISKTIKFKDIEGNEKTIKAYFNLNEGDQAQLSLLKKGGLKAYMEQCLDTEDGYGVATFLRVMIEKSYGKKVRDPELGVIFMKDEAETAKFMNSEAFSKFFTDLLQDEKLATEFINGLPSSVNAIEKDDVSNQ